LNDEAFGAELGLGKDTTVALCAHLGAPCHAQPFLPSGRARGAAASRRCSSGTVVAFTPAALAMPGLPRIAARGALLKAQRHGRRRRPSSAVVAR
jgi:hypothetical protein